MSAEERLTELSLSATELIKEVSGKFDEWDAKVEEARKRIDSFIEGARGEYTGIRITPNQTGRISTGNILPDGWGSGARILADGESISSAISFHIEAGNPNNQPYQQEVDKFYQDIGINKPGWFNRRINVVEISWSNLQEPFVFFLTIFNLGSSISHGAFIRRLSGSLEGSWWVGTSDENLILDKWVFAGDTEKRYSLGSYAHNFLMLSSASGKIQILAPAVVVGGYADKYWNLYPNFSGIID